MNDLTPLSPLPLSGVLFPEPALNALTIVEQVEPALEASASIAASIKEQIRRIEEKTLEANCAYDDFLSLPPTEWASLLEHHPVVFYQLLQHLSLDENKNILEHLTKEINNWTHLLEGVFPLLNGLDGFQPLSAGDCVDILSRGLSPRRKKQWIKSWSSKMRVEDWAFFVVRLPHEERTFACNVFTKYFSFELSEKGFSPCFEALAQQVHFPNRMKSILNTLLHKFYRAKKFDQILNRFDRLNLKAQVCLLDAMGRRNQKKILHQYRDDPLLMASWLDELFHYRADFTSRNRMIKRFFRVLRVENVSEFLQTLTIINSKMGSYFLASLPERDFHEFTVKVPRDVRTELLLNGIVDSSISRVVQAIEASPWRRRSIFETMGLNMENPLVPVDPDVPFTLNDCFRELQAVSLNLEFAQAYIPFILQIPPVLIGLLASISDHRAVLFRLAPSLSEEQLKCAAFALPDQDYQLFIENISPSLNNSQFQALLEGMSTNQLASYIQLKTQQLRGFYQEFRENYQELQTALDAIKEGESISTQRFDALQSQIVKLISLVLKPALIDFQELSLFLKRSQMCKTFTQDHFPQIHAAIEEFKQTMNHLNHKRPLLEGPHALISKKISELIVAHGEEESEDAEIDLTMVLYEGFWALVREGTLPYLGISPHSSLGITHAGQLTCLGIRSNQDLEYLSFTSEQQSQVENLRVKIENIQKSPQIKPKNLKEKPLHPEEEILDLKTLWEQYIDIKFPEKQSQTLCHQIVQALNIQQRDAAYVKGRCLNLYQELLKFPHLSPADKNSLWKGIQQLQARSHPVGIMRTVPPLLEKGLIMLRGFIPLISLQRYLTLNTHLKQTWEKFHEKRWFSISTLMEKRIVKTSSDLMRLERIANQLQLG